MTELNKKDVPSADQGMWDQSTSQQDRDTVGQGRTGSQKQQNEQQAQGKHDQKPAYQGGGRAEEPRNSA